MRRAAHHPARGGYAMLAVLLVLLSLLFVLAPFLATVNNAEETAARRVDHTAANLALDNAARLGKARLAATHRAWDSTPFSDSAAELAVRNDLDPEFADMNGARWDLDVEDLSGRIDLDTAPPALIANLLGTATRLTAFMNEADERLEVSSTRGFPEAGVLWVAGELIGYEGLEPNAFTGLSRGLGAEVEAGTARPLASAFSCSAPSIRARMIPLSNSKIEPFIPNKSRSFGCLGS